MAVENACCVRNAYSSRQICPAQGAHARVSFIGRHGHTRCSGRELLWPGLLPSPTCDLQRRSAPHVLLGASLAAPFETIAIDHQSDPCDPPLMRIRTSSDNVQSIPIGTFLPEGAEGLASACAIVVDHRGNEAGRTAFARIRVRGPCADDRRFRCSVLRYHGGRSRFELRKV